MTQLEMSSLRIIEFRPEPNHNTAHLSGTALCEDGRRYYVKGIDGNSSVCATEWACTSIAHSLNIPAPNMKVLRNKDGLLVFGSQALPHCLPDVQASMLLLDGPRNTLVPEMRNVLSATYALDQLISNNDRHDYNYLIQNIGIVDGQDTANLHLIDFGHSTLLNFSEPLARLPRHSNTVRYGKKIRQAHGFSIDSALAIIRRFEKGRDLICDNIMFGLPDVWLSKTSRNLLISKIMSEDFGTHINDLSQGLSDGTCL